MTMTLGGCAYYLTEDGSSSGTTENWPNGTPPAGSLLMVFACSVDRGLDALTGYTRVGTQKDRVGTNAKHLYFDVWMKIANGSESNVAISYGQNTPYAGHIRWYANPVSTNVVEIASSVVFASNKIKVTQTADAPWNRMRYITAAAFLGLFFGGVSGGAPTSPAGGNFGNVSPGGFNLQQFGGMVEADDLNPGHLTTDRYECDFGFNGSGSTDSTDYLGYFLAVGDEPLPADGETYYGFLIQGASGGSYSSVAGGGGATWTKQEEVNNQSAHGMLFSDNVGASHASDDLPALTVTFNSAPVQAGHAVLVAMGSASGTPGIGHRTNDGGGDNPTAQIVYFGPSAGNALVFTLSVDNGGTYDGAPPIGYTLLASGVLGSGGTAIHWYTYAKYPSSADGGAGWGDDRQLYLGLTGTNIHWTLTQVEVTNPGTNHDPYVIDHGAAAVVGNTLTFTAGQHGPFPTPPENTVPATLTGVAEVDETLTAVPGTWTNSPVLTYQWRRCDAAGATCSDIAAATASTYVVTDADIGSTIRVVVTGTNDDGAASTTTGQTAVTPTPSTGLPPYLLAAYNNERYWD